MKTVHLIDASGYIFRAYYAVSRSLQNKSGFPTNALYGYTRMLIKLLEEAESESFVVAFDAGKKTFRNDLYPEYKANRTECPEDLAQQMPYFRRISEALGLCVMELPGYEADDLIGTFVKRLNELDIKAVIVSADKDLMQLINGNVSMWDTMRDRRFSVADVVKKFGVKPDKVVEVLSLIGDASDNIPGLSGVGPKTAAQLIEKYGDLENVIKSAEIIREDKDIRNRKKIAETIELEADTVRLSRKLVELDMDVPIEFNHNSEKIGLKDLNDSSLLEMTRRDFSNTDEFASLLDQFDFTTLLKEQGLNPSVAKPESTRGFSYKTVYKDDFADWLKFFHAQKEFAFDLETTSLDVKGAQIVGASFCWSETEAFYLPIGHVEQENIEGKQIDLDEFLKECGSAISNDSISMCGQNLKYDFGVLSCHGLEINGPVFDSMVAAYLLNPDRGSYNMTALAAETLNMKVSSFKDVIGDKPDFSFVDIAEATHYAAEDAHVAWLLKEKYTQRLKDENLYKLASDLEMPLVAVLSKIECRGVLIDSTLLEAMSVELSDELKLIEAEIYKLSGVEFNINSPKQLSDVLFNQLGISTKGLRKTKTGVSTDFRVLESLRDEHPVAEELLKYRNLFKLKSTYIDVLPKLVSDISGRLHTRYNQCVTGTGRLSSSDPNLQNIPIQTAIGNRIRSAFIAPAEALLIAADYSQVELRILAHMSEDENLIRAFEEKTDIHAKTAREILNIPNDEELPPPARRLGKTMNFGIIYGMGAFRLARELGVPIKVAGDYIESYFNNYPGVKRFFASLESDIESKGAVFTLFGRRRVVADINSTGRDHGFVRRAAMNAPIQGTAADLIKLAMIKIEDKIAADRLPLKLVMQIHDELVFECDNRFKDEAIKLVRHEMEHVAELRVPLEVELSCGRNWQEAHS